MPTSRHGDAAPFHKDVLTIDPAAMAERIRRRRADASDATPEVLARQAAADPGAIDWLRLDAGGGAEATEQAARRALGIG